MFTASTLITSQTVPLIDIQDEVEVAREQLLADLVKPLVKELLPEDRDLPHLGAVLNLACGQGGLVQELANEYPELEVAGVDVSPALIATNNAQVRAQGLTNASYGVVDLSHPPFDFSAATFDLVTASFLQSRLEERDFPPLLSECARILKPGGWIRLVECESGWCTSLAVEDLSQRYEEATRRAGLHPIPANRAHDLDSKGALRTMLAEAKLPISAVRRVTLDFSACQPAHTRMQQVILVFFELVKPHLLRMQVVSETEYVALMRQAACEMSLLGFQGRWHLLALWGRKSTALCQPGHLVTSGMSRPREEIDGGSRSA
jgi:SAM-dependent methyltransferase